MWRRAKDRVKIKGYKFRNPRISRKVIFLKHFLAIPVLHDQTKLSTLSVECTELCIQLCWAKDEQKNQNSSLY